MSWMRLVPSQTGMRLSQRVICSSVFRTNRVRCNCVATAVEEAVPAVQTEYPPIPFRAAIDFKSILENIDKVKVNAVNRKSNADPDKVVELYQKFVVMSKETDELRKQRNDNAKAMKVRPAMGGLLFTQKAVCLTDRVPHGYRVGTVLGQDSSGLVPAVHSLNLR